MSASPRGSGPRLVYRFVWPVDGGALAAEDDSGSKVGEFPITGPLAAFRRRAKDLSCPPPDDASRPWVLAADDRVIKAYDLRGFGPIDRRVALHEAEVAAAIADIPGVVTTYRTGVVGDWLVIEMDRLGETVSAYLAAIAIGRRLPLQPELWGRLFEEVSHTVAEIHRRRLIHRDIKPANIMFDRTGEHLVVGDFSISSRQRSRVAQLLQRDRRTPNSDALGTRRYIAPEQFRGRVGPSSDQYALGVTAWEVLGDEVVPQVRLVLLRATSQEPEDRFPTIADFGVALRAALDDRVPRRLSLRLQSAKPQWRHAWGPGSIVAACTYLGLFWLRVPNLRWRAGLGIPFLCAIIATVGARVLSSFRGSRSQPRFRVADRPWFPILLFAAFMVGVWPIILDNPVDNAFYALYAFGGAFMISAALGSLPRNAGEWLIRIVRRWELLREGHRGRRALWWGGRAAVLLTLSFASWLPVAASERWPIDRRFELRHATAEQAPALAVVAEARLAMLAGSVPAVCALTGVPASSDMVQCDVWGPVASGWLKEDMEGGRGPKFIPSELRNVSLNPTRSETDGDASWLLVDDRGDREYVGTLERRGETGTVWEVSVTRAPSRRDGIMTMAAAWNYEVVRSGRKWSLTLVEVCDHTVADPCVLITQIRSPDIDAVVRRGSPG